MTVVMTVVVVMVVVMTTLVVVIVIVVVLVAVQRLDREHVLSPPSQVLEISTSREIWVNWAPRPPRGQDAVEGDDPVGDGR